MTVHRDDIESVRRLRGSYRAAADWLEEGRAAALQAGDEERARKIAEHRDAAAALADDGSAAP